MYVSSKPEPYLRVDVGDVTLIWGDRTRAKAELRSESLQRHLALPLEERLRAALELVLPRRADR